MSAGRSPAAAGSPPRSRSPDALAYTRPLEFGDVPIAEAWKQRVGSEDRAMLTFVRDGKPGSSMRQFYQQRPIGILPHLTPCPTPYHAGYDTQLNLTLPGFDTTSTTGATYVDGRLQQSANQTTPPGGLNSAKYSDYGNQTASYDGSPQNQQFNQQHSPQDSHHNQSPHQLASPFRNVPASSLQFPSSASQSPSVMHSPHGGSGDPFLSIHGSSPNHVNAHANGNQFDVPGIQYSARPSSRPGSTYGGGGSPSTPSRSGPAHHAPMHHNSPGQGNNSARPSSRGADPFAAAPMRPPSRGNTNPTNASAPSAAGSNVYSGSPSGGRPASVPRLRGLDSSTSNVPTTYIDGSAMMNFQQGGYSDSARSGMGSPSVSGSARPYTSQAPQHSGRMHPHQQHPHSLSPSPSHRGGGSAMNSGRSSSRGGGGGDDRPYSPSSAERIERLERMLQEEAQKRQDMENTVYALSSLLRQQSPGMPVPGRR